MSRRCSGCAALRDQVSPRWDSCKDKRLCDVVDPALLHRYPRESTKDYQDRARFIEVAHVQALQEYQGREAFPVQGHELVECSKAIHELIFGVGDPLIAGKFRTHPCTFGRPGHERYGSSPDEILRDMCAFNPGLPPTTLKDARWWGANFLHRFFAIHPFTDGNGRVARLLLIWGIEESGDLRLSENWFDRGAERRYVRALEHAHANYRGEGRQPHVAGQHYLRPLSQWLSGRLAEIGDDDLGDEDLDSDFDVLAAIASESEPD